MEESYPAEAGINEWISGGVGDIETIADNFQITPWKCKEVVNLLEWMRNYNRAKPIEEQIRFYAMDIQNVMNINLKIRDFVEKHKIPVTEEQLSIVDSCTIKIIDYNKTTDWADVQIPKLEEIKQKIMAFQADTTKINDQEFNAIRRALDYLIKYTYYLQNSKSEVRDLKMFENVKWIVSNEAKNGKAFIWAHNEHINNKEMLSYGSGWVNLGAHLKNHYKSDYYSVGFDFGIGKLLGLVNEKNRPTYWKAYQMDKPYRKTYAETLINAKDDIYFIDMDKAMSGDPTNFFSTKKKQLVLGALGFNPQKYYLIPKKYSEMFDGLIFVKSISVPDYKLNE